MNTVVELYRQVRRQFPELSSSADVFHKRRWRDLLDEDGELFWFEALADALNDEMNREIPCGQHQAFFQMLTHEYVNGSDEVRGCIDTSFVENLFFQIASVKARPYWEQLHPALKRLYLAFHGIEP